MHRNLAFGLALLLMGFLGFGGVYLISQVNPVAMSYFETPTPVPTPVSYPGAYEIIQDESTPLTQRDTLNLFGVGVTCVDNDPVTDCDIPGGSTSFAIPTGAIDIGDSAVEGVSTDATRADHQHGFTSPIAGYPLDVAAVESDGTATTPARSDHVHAHGTGYLPDAHGDLSYNIVQDESSNLAQNRILNFTGAGVTCTNSAPETDCAIPGGAGDNILVEGVAVVDADFIEGIPASDKIAVQFTSLGGSPAEIIARVSVGGTPQPVHPDDTPNQGASSLLARLDHLHGISDGGAVNPESLNVTGGHLQISGDITPTTWTGNQNDYNPTGLADAVVLRISGNAARNLTGLAGGSDGRIIVLENVGSFIIVVLHDSSSSTAANRFYIPTNNPLLLRVGDTATILYDATVSRWRVLSQPATTNGAIVAYAALNKTKTNIGTVYTDVYDTFTDNGLNQHRIDFSGFREFRIIFDWGYLGTGTQQLRWQVVSDDTKVLWETPTFTTVQQQADSGWQPLIAPFVTDLTGPTWLIVWKGKSTVAGDDPIGRGFKILLR